MQLLMMLRNGATVLSGLRQFICLDLMLILNPTEEQMLPNLPTELVEF